MKEEGDDMAKFNPGDRAFIVENSHTIREVTVGKFSGGFYLIKFESGGGIKVREHRLFATEEEAKASVPIVEKKQGYRSPYDYLH